MSCDASVIRRPDQIALGHRPCGLVVGDKCRGNLPASMRRIERQRYLGAIRCVFVTRCLKRNRVSGRIRLR